MVSKFPGKIKLLNLRVFLIFSILVLAAKICYSIFSGFPGGTYEDWDIAQNLVKYGVYSEFITIGPTAYKLPAYTLFLSFFIWLFGDFAKEAVVLVQHCILFLVPLQIIGLFRVFHKTGAGILAAYLFIFSPFYFYYSNVLEITNIFIPVFLLWIRQFLRIYMSRAVSCKDNLLLGVFTGVLFLTQVIVVPLVLLLLTGLLFMRKMRLYGAVLLLGSAALLYSPWVIRNYVVFDKVILTKTPFWQNIYLSLIPPVNVCDSVKLISAQHDLYTFQLRKTVDEFEMEKIYRTEVLRVLENREEVIVLKALQNAGLLWYVPTRYFYDPSAAVVARKIFVILLNLLTLFALFHLWRRYRLLFWVSLLLFGAFTAPYMIGHAANMRFKLDFEWYQYSLIALFLYERTGLFRMNYGKTKKVAAQSPAKPESGNH